jgi:hypothetical protein
MLALVIDDQRAVLGADHPDTRRSLRVLQHHTDCTAPIQPIGAWWRTYDPPSTSAGSHSRRTTRPSPQSVIFT